MTTAQRGTLDFMRGIGAAARGHSATVLNVLTVDGPLTRNELAEQLGWSRTTLSRAVLALVDSGVLVEDEPLPAHGRGRPEVRLRISPSSGVMIGVDFGIGSMRTLLASPDHSVLSTRERSLEIGYSAQDAFETARRMLDEQLEETGTTWDHVIGAGFAIGAPIEEGTNAVSLDSLASRWRGDVRAWASRYFPCPVTFGNDSRLACFAELHWGAGRALRDFVYLKAHSGVGGAIVMDRRIVRGAHGVAGELGHVIVRSGGERCRCGRRGCLETVVGVAAVIRRLRDALGEELSWSEARSRFDRAEPEVVRVLGEAYRDIGRALASLCSVLDPDVIVLGGAMSRISSTAAGQVAAELRRTALPVNSGVSVRLGELGRMAAARGAAGMVLLQAIA